MKLHNLTIMAAGTTACILAACSREQLSPEPQEQRYTVTATRENSATKTSVDENYSLNWNSEDVIGVFNGSEYKHRSLALVDGDGTPTATFELSDGPLEAGDVYAYYPYDEKVSLTQEGTITVNLDTQTYEFDQESKDLVNFGKYFYMTGKTYAEDGSTNVDISFRNPLSAFVFNLSNNGEETISIKSVSVKTADGSEVFGMSGTLDLADPEASAATEKAAVASADLTDVVLEVGDAIDIPVVVFPCDLSGKELEFTVTYTGGDTEEQTVSKTLAGRNLARNSFAVVRLDFGEKAAAEKLQEVLRNGGTYTLECSISGNFTVSTTEPVTINLNGFTIANDPSEGAGDTFTVSPGSSLTIEGEGTVDNLSAGRAAIYNNGSVTLNGGTYTRSAENSGDNSYYCLLNHGDMTINAGVNVTVDGTNSALIHNAYYDYNAADDRTGYVSGTGQNNPVLTINGGLFEGGNNTVKNGEGGILEINGGTFPKTGTYNILNAHIATISGGEFSGGSASVYTYSEDYNEKYHKAETSIKGGIFNASVLGSNGNNATITVSGGSFSCASISSLKNLIGKLTEDADVSMSLKENTSAFARRFNSTITLNVAKADIDLNGNAITYIGKEHDIFSVDGGNVTIGNGSINATGYDPSDDPQGGISVSGSASLTIDGIQMESTSSCFAVADNGSLTIRNSNVKARDYAVTSNASNPDQNITVTLEDSEFSGNTPVLLNIPSTISVDGCTITGDTQGMVIRGGDATIKDSNITLAIEGSIADNEFFAGYFNDKDWGTGNMVNVAALTIGNKSENAYQYPTSVSLLGNTVLTVTGEAESLFPAVYAYANQGEGLGVSFNYDETVKFVGTHEPIREYGSSNIMVNGKPFTPATE